MNHESCSVDRCTGHVVARGWCPRHYDRWRRYGDPTAPDRRSTGLRVDRFWSLVEKGPDCWIWRGTHTNGGYGTYGTTTAHRIAYKLLVGPIPAGLHVDHLCRVRLCVNPAHLEAVTPGENLRRRPGAIPECCPNGHPYSGANLYQWSQRPSFRYCRKCRAAAEARRRARARAA